MRWFLLVAIGCLLATADSIRAAEPTAAFLEGLRMRQDFDLALEHIAKLEKNPNTPAEVRATLNFERGVTLLQQAKKEQSDTQKRAQMQAAVQALQKYLDQRPGGLKELQARVEMGMVIIEHARQFMRNAADSPEELQAVLHVKGREQYAEALKVYEQIERSSMTQLESAAVLADEMQKDEYRKQVLQARLLIAVTREEMSETHPKGSDEQQAALEQAVSDYEAIYQTYRTRLAGLYARLYQARSLQKLGNHKKALPLLDELLANPDEPEPFRVLRIKVLVLAADSWLATKEHEKLIVRVQPILDSVRSNEEKSEDFAALRAKIAEAQKAKK